LSTALWLQKHLVWEVMSVVYCIVAAKTSGLGGYVSSPLHCGCRNIWFGRLYQLSTAPWMQKYVVWEVMSVVHCTVAAEISGSEVISVVHCTVAGEISGLEVISVVHCTVAAKTSGLGGYVSCPLHSGCKNIWFGRLCQLSTALWLQKYLVWEVMSVVHCTVAAEKSGLGSCVSCPPHCGCKNIWFGRLLQ